jgi:Ser/Thr protein kinase RdoA (MazF antagonist)
VLAAWGLERRAVTPVSDGLINDTFMVGRRHVLQRLHPVFGAEVNLDIAALCRPLLAAGLVVPELCPTRGGALWVQVEAAAGPLAGVWRVLTRVPGRTLHRLTGARMAASAGALVGRFHRALTGIEHTFHFERADAHDTPRHMTRLEAAVAAHPAHRLASEVAPLARDILACFRDLPPPPALPRRLCHGDLKVSNLRFAPRGARAIAILDLDTLAWQRLDVELGDALRSWCNPRAEHQEPAWDPGLFAAALAGWQGEAGGLVDDTEIAAIPGGVLRISLELAARFAIDALEERYFGWSSGIAPTRGEHNLLRARGQWGVARQVARVWGRDTA